MAELNFTQQNVLGDCLNVSFGKSSIREKGYAVNFNVLNDSENNKMLLDVRFETIVNFNPRHGLTEQRKELDRESIQIISSVIANCKKQFKEQAEVSLKCKEITQTDPLVEHISHNPSLVRAKYYRSIIYHIEV